MPFAWILVAYGVASLRRCACTTIAWCRWPAHPSGARRRRNSPRTERVEVTLQDQGGGQGVVIVVIAQQVLRLHACAALVDQLDCHAITPMQLIGKAPTVACRMLLTPGGGKGQAYLDTIGLPFVEQVPDRCKTLFARHRPQNLQRPGLPRERIADGHPDLL